MNGVLLIDKPSGMTSHDVVFKLRKILKTRQIGHTGTLDPNATGLLQVLVGKSTKLSQFLVHHDKEYIATCRLGVETDTQDIWGKIIKTQSIPPLDNTIIEKQLDSLLGTSEQLPPMYAAIKYQGKKLYEYARQQITVPRETRTIQIDEISLISFIDNEITFKVSCSSGTYIRTLCMELAQRLGTIGTMSQLRRTKVGLNSIDDAITIEQVQAGDFELMSPLDALHHYHHIEITDINPALQGKPLFLDITDDIVLLTHNKQAIAFYQRDKGNQFRSKRGLW